MCLYYQHQESPVHLLAWSNTLKSCNRPHFVYSSLYLLHPFQVLLSVLMSTWVESGVIDKGDIQNVQGWRSQNSFGNHCNRPQFMWEKVVYFSVSMGKTNQVWFSGENELKSERCKQILILDFYYFFRSWVLKLGSAEFSLNTPVLKYLCLKPLLFRCV